MQERPNSYEIKIFDEIWNDIKKPTEEIRLALINDLKNNIEKIILALKLMEQNDFLWSVQINSISHIRPDEEEDFYFFEICGEEPQAIGIKIVSVDGDDNIGTLFIAVKQILIFEPPKIEDLNL